MANVDLQPRRTIISLNADSFETTHLSTYDFPITYGGAEKTVKRRLRLRKVVRGLSWNRSG